jgi:DNA-binding transcriptional MerR regulator
MSDRSAVVIPDRPSFKASEVCELLGIQPYVLRTWENEFKDLGVAKAAGAPRVYRRRDVELALRIKALVFTDGLTLAGARRRLEQENLLVPPATDGEDEAGSAEGPSEIEPALRERLATITRGLREILAVLSRTPGRASGGEPRVVSGQAGSGLAFLEPGVPASPSSRSVPAAGPAEPGRPDPVEFELVPGGVPQARASGTRAAASQSGAARGAPRRGRADAAGRSGRRAT